MHIMHNDKVILINYHDYLREANENMKNIYYTNELDA